MSSIVDLLKETKGDAVKEINVDEFKSALSQVDSQVKNFPATTQVAAQQGTYLADCFNRMDKCEKHLEGLILFKGSGCHLFRPFQIQTSWSIFPTRRRANSCTTIGHSSQWLWYSVYARRKLVFLHLPKRPVLLKSTCIRRKIDVKDGARVEEAEKRSHEEFKGLTEF